MNDNPRPVRGPALSGGELSIDKTARINEGIRVREVRLIDADGVAGRGSSRPKRRCAWRRQQCFDLVEVAPEAKPPVCRIMDFGKFLYQQKKKTHESKKKQKIIHVKEVKFRPNIDDHDYDFKLQERHAVPGRGRQGQGHRPVPRPRNGEARTWATS